MPKSKPRLPRYANCCGPTLRRMVREPGPECPWIGKHCGHRWAFKECDLEILSGHIVGLVGPNGAGKTTCLTKSCPRHGASNGPARRRPAENCCPGLRVAA